MTATTQESTKAAAIVAPVSPNRTLVRKLAEVMMAVERIPKRGRNQHFNYDFATESDITAAIRNEMALRHLMMFPHVESMTWRETRNGSQSIVCVMVRFTVCDGDSGESEVFIIPGEGQDPGDKCVPKALTSATKYALLKLFLVPTGDDPEATDEEGRSTARKAEPVSPPPEPAGLTEWLDDLSAVADNGEAALRAAWSKSPSNFRDFLSHQRGVTWAVLKERAAKVKS